MDTATGIYTQIANDILSGYVPHSLTSDGAGGFYTEGGFTLWAVNASGIASDIAPCGAKMYGMDRSSDGTIYGYNYNDDNLGKVTTTGVWNPIGASSSFSGDPVGGRLAFMNGGLYGTISDAFGAFDLGTGFFGKIATDDIYQSMVLASDGTTLYGLSGNSLYTLDPTNGSYGSPLTITGLDEPVWTGASFAAVPEVTSSFTMLGLISSGLLLRRRGKVSL